MSTSIKKFVAAFLSLMIALSLSACSQQDGSSTGGPDASHTSQPPGPVSDSSEQEISDLFGIDIAAPDGADSPSYHIIDSGSAGSIAELCFVLDKINVTFHIRQASAAEDISGVYSDWKDFVTSDLSGKDAFLRYNSGEDGVVYWYDVSLGMTFSVSVDSGASPELLLSIAGNIYSSSSSDSAGQTEGGPVSAGSEIFGGSFGYSIKYDPEFFTAVVGETDTLSSVYNDGSSPNVYLSVQKYFSDDYTSSQLQDGIVSQHDDYECTTGTASIGIGPYKALTVSCSAGTDSDSETFDFYIVSCGTYSLVFELGCYVGAQEGYGARMQAMLGTLIINDYSSEG